MTETQRHKDVRDTEMVTEKQTDGDRDREIVIVMQNGRHRETESQGPCRDRETQRPDTERQL